MAYENDILTRNDNDELAVRTVQSVGDNPASSYDDVYTRDNNGKLAVRVVGSGGDSHNKGYFATQAALEEAYPTGEAGDYAIVGSTDTVWIWDDDNSEWVDTDTKGEVVSVNGKTGTVVLNASDVGALENTATGTDSLTILGTPATSNSGAINIGSGSSATGAGIAIGKNSTSGKIAIGVNANCSASGYMAIGNDSEAGTFGTAIGDGAKATGNTALAIGFGAKATAGASVAIGLGSKSSADYAIQIGGSGVTNSEANTIKIGLGSLPAQNYKLLDSDGTIPADRLVHAINKYSTMPTAASTNEGWIVQFTGTTDATYTHGHLYECVSDGGNPATYSWTEVSMGGGAVNSVNNQTGNVFLDAEDVGAIPQLSTMPTASASDVGNIVQFKGTTTGTYTNGYFYKGTGTSVTVPESMVASNLILYGDPVNDVTITINASDLITALGTYTELPSDEVIRNLQNSTNWSLSYDFDNNVVTSLFWEGWGILTSSADIVACFSVSTTGSYSGENEFRFTGTYTAEHTETQVDWERVDVQPAPSGLPDQTGQSGKFLTTDGTDASWSDKPVINRATGIDALAIGTAGTSATGLAGTAIGQGAVCSGDRAIQFGYGTNNENNTMKVSLGYQSSDNYKLLNSDGTIPTDRYTTTPVADGTYVPTLTISSGVATRSWAAPGGGGGGSATATTATLAANAWSSNSQTVNVTGVTSSNIVFVMPAPATQGAYNRADIQCTAQGSGTLTFTCGNVPTTAITVNIIIM